MAAPAKTRTTPRAKRHPVGTWTGPERRYDLIAEGTIAVILVAVLCIVASILWGSPNGGLTRPKGPASPAGQAFSAKYWDTNDPSDLAQTAVQELLGATTTAGYGPPFNTTTGASQGIIGIQPAEIAKSIFGLTLPINTANGGDPHLQGGRRRPCPRRARRQGRLGPAGNLAQQLRQGSRPAKRDLHPHVGHGVAGQLRTAPGDHQG